MAGFVNNEGSTLIYTYVCRFFVKSEQKPQLLTKSILSSSTFNKVVGLNGWTEHYVW